LSIGVETDLTKSKLEEMKGLKQKLWNINKDLQAIGGSKQSDNNPYDLIRQATTFS
jgi:hypothetical protein